MTLRPKSLSVLVPLFAALLPVLSVTVHAQQEPPKPPAEVTRLSVFEGSWEGSGSYDFPQMAGEWSGTMTNSWLVGGFAMESKQVIEVGPGMQILASTVMGYDPAQSALQFYNFANDGSPGAVATASWVDQNTLIETRTQKTDEGPVIRRSTWKFGKDSATLLTEVAYGSEPFETEITGKYRRLEETPDYPAETRFQFGPPVAPEMGKLDPLLGEWVTAGWMELPQVGKLPLTGTESIGRRMGGHLIEYHTTGIAEGDPNPYEARSWLQWVPELKGYRMISVSNMGEWVNTPLRWVSDDTLVNFVHTDWLGETMLSRGTMVLGDDRIVVDAHAMMGMGAPGHMFHIVYEPKDV